VAAKKTSSKKPKQSKSDFIRSQPSTVSTADVVAKAKAAGMKISSTLVYMVRGRAGGKGKAKKAAAKKTLATPSASTKKSATSKADFVRAHANLSPKAIVEKAKAEGVKFDASYVYNVRTYDKAAAKKKRAPKATARRATPARNGASVARPVVNGSGAENLLKAVAAEIGLGKAMEILAGERARVQAVIGG
jgi:hypothetical protein